MSQKKKKEASAPEAPKANYMASIGGLLILFGGLFFASVTIGGMEGPAYLRWLGLAIVVLGGVLWFFSGLPRDQSIEWVRSLAYALGIALVIRWGVAEPYRIPSGSMETTLHGEEGIGKGDRVWVNKWVYGLRYPFMNKRIYYGRPPQRWDIVVFKSVEEGAVHPTLVKRIVGMPGERVQIRNGKVYVSDPSEPATAARPLVPPPGMPDNLYYTSDGMYGVRSDDRYSVVPAGHYLVLGDNSRQSRDGRYFGWLPNEHIVGRVASIWWPPSRWRDFTGFSQTLWWRALLVLLGGAVLVRLFVARSWPVHAAGGRLEHLLVLFLPYGLRLPFTRVWLWRWGGPRRGELVLHAPRNGVSRHGFAPGRVAALPGDAVQWQDGTLLVHGAPLDAARFGGVLTISPEHVETIFGKGRRNGAVPEGHYLVLMPSPPGVAEELLDSRHVGWIPDHALAGRAAAVWWPLGRMRRIV